MGKIYLNTDNIERKQFLSIIVLKINNIIFSGEKKLDCYFVMLRALHNMIFNKGPFTNYVSNQRGEGVWKNLKTATKRGQLNAANH